MLKQEFDFIARGAPPGTARQLAFLLHGYGRNATIMEKVAEEIEKTMPGARILMVNAPEVCPSGDEAERRWFSVQGSMKDMGARVSQVAQRLNDFIDNQRDVLGLQDKDVALMGFSQGGGVALYTAFARPQPIGSIVAHSTLFFGSKPPASVSPTLFIYGDADESIPQLRFQDSISYLGQHVPDLTVHLVPGLRHKTSSESREILARYMAARMTPP